MNLILRVGHSFYPGLKVGSFCITVFRNRKCNIVDITYLNL